MGMRRGGGLLLAACMMVALGAGCTQTLRLPDTGDDAEYFVLRVPGSATEAKLTSDGITGANIQVSRGEHALRGWAYGASVQVFWTEEQVSGNVAGSPVDLKVEQDGNILRFRGLYAGKNGNFSIQPGKLEGTVGQCTYTMKTSLGGLYDGQVTCGGMPADATLQLPPALASFYPAEIAAYLAVFLGR